MNVFGSMAGLFFGAIGGAVIGYLIPQLQGTLHQTLACVGIAFAGWKVAGFLDDNVLTKWVYVVGLLGGYFGWPHLVGGVTGVVPAARPMPEIP